jgi:hypothetical protein
MTYTESSRQSQKCGLYAKRSVIRCLLYYLEISSKAESLETNAPVTIGTEKSSFIEPMRFMARLGFWKN